MRWDQYMSISYLWLAVNNSFSLLLPLSDVLTHLPPESTTICFCCAPCASCSSPATTQREPFSLSKACRVSPVQCLASGCIFPYRDDIGLCWSLGHIIISLFCMHNSCQQTDALFNKTLNPTLGDKDVLMGTKTFKGGWHLSFCPLHQSVPVFIDADGGSH